MLLFHSQEIDVRAGGGQTSTIGVIVRHMVSKLDWHATLFPRIPVPVQKDMEKRLAAHDQDYKDQMMRERMQQHQRPEWDKNISI